MPRVLLVDDDPQLTRITHRRLQRAGFEVVSTNRSFGVLNLVASTRPDVVLMDMKMPGLPGKEILGLLRRDSELRETRVVLYSGMDVGELRAACEQAGADGFVHKMESFEYLMSVLRECQRRTE